MRLKLPRDPVFEDEVRWVRFDFKHLLNLFLSYNVHVCLLNILEEDGGEEEEGLEGSWKGMVDGEGGREGGCVCVCACACVCVRV